MNLTLAFSLGCGPQAGNITSENITARHLINVKRVAFRRSDWDQIDRDDHAYAASLGGEQAPRGSGLPGDPALSIGKLPTAPTTHDGHAASNWQGNPGVLQAAEPQRAPQPKVQVAPKAGGGAPRFSDAARSHPLSSVAPTARAVPPMPKVVQPMSSGANVGSHLSATEIQGILQTAGSGCPLGPCQGCPHHEPSTGACKA